MIRIRDISLPPEHTVNQLPYQAARMLRVENSRIKQVQIVRKSIDARKKPDVKVIYTIDVKLEGNEEKILRRSGCKKASIAPVYKLQLPYLNHPPANGLWWLVLALQVCLLP